MEGSINSKIWSRSFETRYTTTQEQIADELLRSWHDTDRKIQIIKTEVRPKLESALESYRAANVTARAETQCSNQQHASQTKPAEGGCAAIIARADKQIGLLFTENTYDSKRYISAYREVYQHEQSNCRELLKQLREETANPENLKELLTRFDEAEKALADAEEHLQEYQNNARRIQGRLKNLTLFLFSRVEEIVWNPPSDRIRANTIIKGLENRVTSYSPPRLPFDSIQGYVAALRNMRADLDYLLDIPKQIVSERDRQLAGLKRFEAAVEDNEAECGRSMKLEGCIAQCASVKGKYESDKVQKNYLSASKVLAQLNELGCPFVEKNLSVPVPDIRGLTTSAAHSALSKNTLRMIVDYEGATPDKEESTYVRKQSPGGGSTADMNGIVTAILYRYDPDAMPTPCSQLKTRYRNAMASKKPEPKVGKSILATADHLSCYWTAKAQQHYAEAVVKYEQFKKEKQLRTERLCGELYDSYKEKMASEGQQVDFSAGMQILDQAQKCDWYERARAHYAQSQQRYNDTQVRLEEARLRNYCQDLAVRFDAAVAEANNTLDPSELHFILSSSQNCAWHDRATAMMPCLEGEYNSLRAYNGGDLHNASSWTDWGKSNNCSYVTRLKGLIDQRAAQLQQQNNQQNPGFWETFGQSLAQGLEEYNQQMQAQMQQQTEQYMNQAIQQQFQNKSTSKPGQQPTQYQTKPKNGSPIGKPVSASATCTQIDSKLLAACRVRNVPLGESLYEQAGRLGCNLSPATTNCIDEYIDEWIRGIEIFPDKDWTKVKNVPRTF